MMEHNTDAGDWLDAVRREFAAGEAVRREFRALLDTGDVGWNTEPSWPQVVVPRAFPRTLWMYWDQGWAHASKLVRLCCESWRRQNPDWELRLLDADSLSAFADVPREAGGKPIAVQHFSDLVRMTLLYEHGGVWADANTVCTVPLDSWLPALMQSGFFAFANPRPGRPISNWFLASEPGGILLGKWLELCRRYWREVSQADAYLWSHYLFAYGCRTDEVFAAGWNATPHVSGYGSVQAQLLKFGADVEADVRASVELGAIPVWKLTHGQQWPEPADTDPLARLTRKLLRRYDIS